MKIDWKKVIVDIFKVLLGAITGAAAAATSGCTVIPVL